LGDTVWYRARAVGGSSIAGLEWTEVNATDSLGAQLLAPIHLKDAHGRVVTVRLVVGGLALTKAMSSAPASESAAKDALLTARPFACR
jgi:hypothetical protein